MLRREFLPLLGVPLFGAEPNTIGFNAGTYGAKSMKASDALRKMVEIGYDGVEIALMPGWTIDRADVRRVLQDTGLAVPSCIESLPMNGTPQNRAHNLERLKLAIDFAREVVPGKPPVIETVIGNKSSEWEQVKSRMADELHAWARLAETNEVTICFKPHASNAVDMPEKAIWLLQQINSPRIRLCYDYSHFFVQGLPLEGSLRTLFPYIAYIAVKDSRGTGANPEYLLPGDGTTDYVAYFRLLKELGYGGFVGVEVTAQLFSKPGYDPVSTMELCYARLAPAFTKAAVQRPKRGGR